MVGVKTISSVGVVMLSQPISTPKTQNNHLKHIFYYTFDDSPHFFCGEPLSCNIKTTIPEEEFPWGQKKELISHVSVIS